MSTNATVLDQIGQFFSGGTYNTTLRRYPIPTAVSGLSVVRRSWPKEDVFEEYTGGVAGVTNGAVMVIQVANNHDRRIALPAVSGRREVHYGIQLHTYIWSYALFAEDCQDYVYNLVDALKAKLRTDPTLGSGGFENGAFMAGEGGEGDIVTEIQQGATVKGTTKAFFLMSFVATAYEVG